MSEEETRWCGQCGLKLSQGMPMIVWNGHQHKPVTESELRAATTVWAVANEAGKSHPAAALLARAGITEQACDMFNRTTSRGEL